MTDGFFKLDKNLFTSAASINRAVVFMRNTCVPDQFEISNNPLLTGWNPLMSIEDILTQLEKTYGQPDAAAIFANNNLFQSPFQSRRSRSLILQARTMPVMKSSKSGKQYLLVYKPFLLCYST